MKNSSQVYKPFQFHSENFISSIMFFFRLLIVKNIGQTLTNVASFLLKRISEKNVFYILPTSVIFNSKAFTENSNTNNQK